MFTKLIRLGRDAELKTATTGTQVLNFAGAYKVGYGQNEKTQWIDCALWGDRGASVAQYMKKGSQIVIYGDQLQTEEFTKNDGSLGFKLKCRIVSFDFAGGTDTRGSSPVERSNAHHSNGHTQQPQQPQQQMPPQAAPVNSLDDSYDIPF